MFQIVDDGIINSIVRLLLRAVVVAGAGAIVANLDVIGGSSMQSSLSLFLLLHHQHFKHNTMITFTVVFGNLENRMAITAMCCFDAFPSFSHH